VNLVLSSYLLSTGRNKIEVRFYRGQTLSSYPKRPDRRDDDSDPGDQRDVSADQDDVWPMSVLVMRMVAAALTAICCTQLLRGKSPAMAQLLSIATVVGLAATLFPQLKELAEGVQRLFRQTGLEMHLFLPVVKVLAITQITRISAELCRDAGERGIAAKLELGGAAVSLLCIFPLVEEALEMIGALNA